MYKELIYKLAGDDYGIIRRCEKSTQERFLTIGLFVPIIFSTLFYKSLLHIQTSV